MSFIGKIVEVIFEDHCIEVRGGEKTDRLMRFKVWGRVQSFTKKTLVIKTWELQDADKETTKHNNEIAKILVPSIISIRVLEFQGTVVEK